MIEELLTDDNHLPNDWKVHVFHGKAGFIQYDTGRMTSHSQSIYTLDGQRIHQTNGRWSEEHTPDEIVSILGRKRIDELIHIGERLAEDIDYARVDLFLADGSGTSVNSPTTTIRATHNPSNGRNLPVGCG